MLTKLADIAAATNYFKDPETGQQRKFYKPIGSLMENENGNQFLMLDKSFNLLATMSDPEKGSVCLPVNYVQDKPKKKPSAKTPKAKSISKGAKASKDLYHIPFDDNFEI